MSAYLEFFASKCSSEWRVAIKKPAGAIVCVAAGLSSVASGVGGCCCTPHARAIVCVAAVRQVGQVGRVGRVGRALPPTGAIVGVAAKITQRVVSRSGASTGCSGLCPLPNSSQTLPIHPNSIVRHIRLRCTTPRQAGVRLATVHSLPFYNDL